MVEAERAVAERPATVAMAVGMRAAAARGALVVMRARAGREVGRTAAADLDWREAAGWVAGVEVAMGVQASDMSNARQDKSEENGYSCSDTTRRLFR